ncbi:hypothetical protein [uncultured Jannaschia sp.]|uniref:hypothetical protein n=1 Tax=uncultured Jannaschia sp. TaxID=293347 RepID=UPI00261D833B|nr:hypothetical protein [uncultured Jannaschia sp.]
MLNRRPAKPTPDPLADAVTNPEKARALLALLEAGDTSKVPPERLRDWASDLVRTVERQKADAKAQKAEAPAPRPRAAETAPPRAPVAAAPAAVAPAKAAPEPKREPGQPRRSRLFRSSAPTLAQGTAPQSATPAIPAAPVRPAPTAPASQAPHLPRPMTAVGRQSQPQAVQVRPMPTRAQVRAMVNAAVNPATLPDEHPAVIALTLTGKPSIEQAKALRSLPGGKVRAVHRALRQLEMQTE